jgi:hypothetical protein
MSKNFGTGKYCSYCFEDDTSFPLRILPLIMFVKGVTVRILLWTDGWNCVPKKAVQTNAVLADAGVITTVESWFKFDNSWIITSEILLSTDLQKAFYDYIEENEYVSFPCV